MPLSSKGKSKRLFLKRCLYGAPIVGLAATACDTIQTAVDRVTSNDNEPVAVVPSAGPFDCSNPQTGQIVPGAEAGEPAEYLSTYLERYNDRIANITHLPGNQQNEQDEWVTLSDLLHYAGAQPGQVISIHARYPEVLRQPMANSDYQDLTWFGYIIPVSPEAIQNDRLRLTGYQADNDFMVIVYNEGVDAGEVAQIAEEWIAARRNYCE